MKDMYFSVDERTERINGLVSFYCLMLTHAALAGYLAIGRYVRAIPGAGDGAIRAILLLSMGSFWALRLYLSGILPVIRLRVALAIYVAAVAIIAVPSYLFHGWPPPERWYEVASAVIGPALVLGVYSLIAYLGKRRIAPYTAE